MRRETLTGDTHFQELSNPETTAIVRSDGFIGPRFRPWKACVQSNSQSAARGDAVSLPAGVEAMLAITTRAAVACQTGTS